MAQSPQTIIPIWHGLYDVSERYCWGGVKLPLQSKIFKNEAKKLKLTPKL